MFVVRRDAVGLDSADFINRITSAPRKGMHAQTPPTPTPTYHDLALDTLRSMDFGCARLPKRSSAADVTCTPSPASSTPARLKHASLPPSTTESWNASELGLGQPSRAPSPGQLSQAQVQRSKMTRPTPKAHAALPQAQHLSPRPLVGQPARPSAVMRAEQKDLEELAPLPPLLQGPTLGSARQRAAAAARMDARWPRRARPCVLESRAITGRAKAAHEEPQRHPQAANGFGRVR